MRLIAAVGFAAACLFAVPAHAGGVAIETCADRHGDDYKARVACLEAAIRGELTIAAPAAPGAPGAPALETGPKTTTEIALEPPTIASNPAPVAAAETVDDGRPTGLGAEQVIARSGEYERKKAKRPDPLNVEVEDVAYGRTGKAIFILANGQVWREKDKDPRGRRINTKKAYTAEITKARLGGYRMKLEGVTRKLVVERVK